MNRFVRDVARYGVVGVSSTAADVLVYATLTRVVHLPILTSNLLAYLVGHTISFYGNRHWTFRSGGKPLAEYRRFWAVTAVGLGISQTVLALSLHNGLSDIPGKAAAIVCSALWNFSMHRLWTFRNDQKKLL